MKYSIFALLAFSLQLLFSCQNNSTADNGGAAADPGTGTASSISPASDPNKLNEQILTDMLAGRAYSRQFTTVYEESFELIKRMKMHIGSQAEAEKAKIIQMVEEVMVFFLAYEQHRLATDKLDSLSTNLSAGQISVEDAQKEYIAARNKMNEAASKLPSGNATMQKVKGEFEQAFPNAGGGQ